MKYGEVNMGQVEAAINILGGIEVWNELLARRLEITKKVMRWREEDGVITFTLPSTDGTTGEQWIKRTEEKGNRVGDYVQELLFEDFKPTTGVVYTVKVMKAELFSDSDRTAKNIRAEANKRKFSNLNAEASFLIRDNFTDKELKAMGLLYIMVMHDPIKDSVGDLKLLGMSRDLCGRWLCSYRVDLDLILGHEGGFAFSAD